MAGGFLICAFRGKLCFPAKKRKIKPLLQAVVFAFAMLSFWDLSDPWGRKESFRDRKANPARLPAANPIKTQNKTIPLLQRDGF